MQASLQKARIKSAESKIFKEEHSNQRRLMLPSRKTNNPTGYFSCWLSHVLTLAIPATMTGNSQVKDVRTRFGTYSSSKCKAQMQAALVLMLHLHVEHSKGPWVPPSQQRAEAVHPLQAPYGNIPVPDKHLKKETFHSGYCYLIKPHSRLLSLTKKHVSS